MLVAVTVVDVVVPIALVIVEDVIVAIVEDVIVSILEQSYSSLRVVRNSSYSLSLLLPRII